MKEYLIMQIEEDYMKRTNQRVAIFTMSEAEYLKMGREKSSYYYGEKKDIYIIDYDSELSKSLFQYAHNEEIVCIYPMEFRRKIEFFNGKLETLFFHENVKAT